MPRSALWRFVEVRLDGPSAGNPFDVDLFANFTCSIPSRGRLVRGFYDGDGKYIVRFQPDQAGPWTYVTQSAEAQLDGHAGEFEVTAAAAGDHGPVTEAGQHLEHRDRTEFFSVGTTACAKRMHTHDALAH